MKTARSNVAQCHAAMLWLGFRVLQPSLLHLLLLAGSYSHSERRMQFHSGHAPRD